MTTDVLAEHRVSWFVVKGFKLLVDTNDSGLVAILGQTERHAEHPCDIVACF